MKNCVVQFHIPAERFSNPSYNNIGVNEQLMKYSLYSVEQYANRVGADYRLIQQKKINWIHPTFERFDLFFNNEWYDNYDNILYLDTDLIVWPDAPDIFEMYPNNKSFKVCTDRIAQRLIPAEHEKKVKGSALDCFDGNTLRYNRFNAGVFMVNRESADCMKKYLDYKNIDLDDNQLLIYAMLKSSVAVEKMDWRFNKKNGTGSWFGHAYGQQKFKPDYPLLKKAESVFKI